MTSSDGRSASLRRTGALVVLGACAAALHLAYGRVLTVELVPELARAIWSLCPAAAIAGALAVAAWGARDGVAVDERLAALAALFGVLAPFCGLMFVEHLPVEQTLSLHGVTTAALAATLLGIPFAFAGAAMSYALAAATAVRRAFAAVVAGAALGALGGLGLLALLPATVVLLPIGAAACWLALLIAAHAGTSPRGPIAASVVVVFLGVLATTQNVFTLRHVKAWDTAYTEDSAWAATSRVGVFPPEPGTTATRTLSMPRRDVRDAADVDFKWLDVDGADWMPMLHFDGDLARVRPLAASAYYAAQRLRADGRILVIGAGGGRDLLVGRAAGAREVVGIQPDLLVEHIVQERFADYSGQPYRAAGIDVLVGPPRRLLRRVSGTFDVVTLATAPAGRLLPLLDAERYLYTREAFRAYFERLAPDGILGVSRYYAAQDPFDVARVLATVRDAWTSEGVSDVARHVAVVQQEVSATVLARRDPFTPADLERLDQMVAEGGTALLVDPRRPGPLGDPIRLLVGDAADGLAPERFDVRATTDDRPFFPEIARSIAAPEAVDPFGLVPRARDAYGIVMLLAVAGTVIAVAGALAAAAVTGSVAGVVSRVLQGMGTVLVIVPVLQQGSLVLGSPVAAAVAGALALGLPASAAAVVVGGVPGVVSAAPAAMSLVASAVLAWGVGPALAASPAVATLIIAAVLVPLGLLLGLALSADAGDDHPGATLAAGIAGAVAGLALFAAIPMRIGLAGTAASGAVVQAAGAALVGSRRRAAPAVAARTGTAG